MANCLYCCGESWLGLKKLSKKVTTCFCCCLLWVAGVGAPNFLRFI